MMYTIPGPESEKILTKGQRLARNGGTYAHEVAEAKAKGFTLKPPQFINDKAGTRAEKYHNNLWWNNPSTVNIKIIKIKGENLLVMRLKDRGHLCAKIIP